MSDRLGFSELRFANVARCERVFHPLNDWSPAEWACAMAGEAGEACNAVKKLRRVHDGTNTAKDPQTRDEAIAAIAAELADTVIYCDLLAARLGIDLGAAVRAKFNVVSERMGSGITL
jgi:NTP pyrophosphatase (non-canonical NTP hydrolase)